MTDTKTKAPRITQIELDKLAALCREKQAIDRQSRALETEIAQLKSKAAADLLSTGNRTAHRSGYVLRWKAVSNRVQWKEAFVIECGAEKASELQDAAGTKDVIEIR